MVWKKRRLKKGIVIYSFNDKNIHDYLSIHPFRFVKNKPIGWSVESRFKTKGFDKKSQALRFAKKVMKEHKKGHIDF